MPRGKSSKAKSRGPASETASKAAPLPVLFAEAPAWKAIGAGWRPLFGSFRDLGFSFEWHEFIAKEEIDWARSFHPGSLELCLNLDGTGTIRDGRQRVEIQPQTFTFYFQGQPPLQAARKGGEEHRFITIEFSPTFLKEHFGEHADDMHPLVQSILRDEAVASAVATSERLAVTMYQLVESLRHCPVFTPAREMWFRCKAIEVAAQLLFQPAAGEQLYTRTQRLAQERVERAKMILRERMQDPPSLDELAQMVNCSPFYLSRQFTQEGNLTMQQFLRQVRMERAADLLRTGKCNVTEAALEVGYNSLSHFSSTFHETFGCCPGLYPLRTEAQKAAQPIKIVKPSSSASDIKA